MPELDAVRGFAATLVMFYHLFHGIEGGPVTHALCALLRLGWLGVDIFFVLSGFLITGVLLKARDRPRSYYRDFYLRRFFRIFPLYYLCATLIFLLLAMLGESVSRRGMEFTYLFLANMGFFLGFSIPDGPALVYWSLAVEEHFYVVWPAVVRNVSGRAILWVCVAVLVASPALRYFATLWWSPRLNVYFVTFFRLDGFALGGALAVLVDGGRLSVRGACRLGAALAAVGLAVGVAVIAHGGFRIAPFPAALSYTAADLVIAALFVWLLVLCRHSGERRGMLRVFGFLGDISYCTYLVHCSVILVFDTVARRLGVLPWRGDLVPVVRAAAVATVTTGLAALSRRYYEVPMLAVRDRCLAMLGHHARRASSTAAG